MSSVQKRAVTFWLVGQPVPGREGSVLSGVGSFPSALSQGPRHPTLGREVPMASGSPVCPTAAVLLCFSIYRLRYACFVYSTFLMLSDPLLFALMLVTLVLPSLGSDRPLSRSVQMSPITLPEGGDPKPHISSYLSQLNWAVVQFPAALYYSYSRQLKSNEGTFFCVLERLTQKAFIWQNRGTVKTAMAVHYLRIRTPVAWTFTQGNLSWRCSLLCGLMTWSPWCALSGALPLVLEKTHSWLILLLCEVC